MLNSTNELGSYVGVRELSRALGLSRTGIYTLCRRGELPQGIRLGHSRRWNVQEISEFLRAKKIAVDAALG